MLGNDRPGIVRDISAVLSAHALSIESMTSRDSRRRDGRRPALRGVGRRDGSAASDPDALRTDLERLANDLQVDITVA